jgi:SAM-dependent methyltransferase
MDDSVPDNLRFEQRDVTEPWKYDVKFDYIHGRALVICFADPQAVIQQAFDALAPGGYLEYGDPYFPTKWVGVEEAPVNTATYRMRELFYKAAKTIGRDVFAPTRYREMFEKAGFVDIQERRFYWVSHDWPKGEYFKELSKYSFENTRASIYALTGQFFASLGISAEERRKLADDAAKEMDESAVLSYNDV